MEDTTDFQDWELLGPDSTAAVAISDLDASRRAGGDSDGEIKPDYFDLNNTETRRFSSSDGDGKGGGPQVSNDPSLVEPSSGSGLLGEPSTEEGLAAAESPHPDAGGVWTPDESSGVQETLPEVVLEGGGGEGGGACLGGTGETDVVEAGSLVSGELNSSTGDPNITVAAPESPVRRSNGDSGLESLDVARGASAGMMWWKMPLEVLKFCVFRIRPVWSISIAAALLGVLMLGRRLYKKKPKSRSIPLKVAVDDKRVSQFMVRATRLNEAFSVVKRVPVIRSTLPTGGVTPWPVVALT